MQVVDFDTAPIKFRRVSDRDSLQIIDSRDGSVVQIPIAHFISYVRECILATKIKEMEHMTLKELLDATK